MLQHQFMKLLLLCELFFLVWAVGTINLRSLEKRFQFRSSRVWRKAGACSYIRKPSGMTSLISDDDATLSVIDTSLLLGSF